MYQGEHVKKRGKPTALLLAVVLLVGAVIGTTVALLLTQTAPVVNRFEYAKVTCKVDETFDGEAKKDVKIQNTGNIDEYIRATYVVNWLDKDNKIVATVPDGYTYKLTENPDQKWVKYGEYFYYTSPVAPNGKTDGSLLTCTVTYPENPEYTLSVEILADAIQSVPEAAVKAAWGDGFSINTDGTLKVPTSEEAQS